MDKVTCPEVVDTLATLMEQIISVSDLPQFNPENPKKWLRRLEMDAAVNQWTEQKVIRLAYRTMDDDTKAWFVHTGPYENWEKFKEALYGQFPKGKKKSPSEYYNRKRFPNESFTGFIRKKQSLLRELEIPFDFSNFLDEIENSCNSVNFRNFIVSANPEDFEALMEVAVKYKDQQSKIETPISQRQEPSGKTKPPIRTPEKASKVCFKCGKSGHFRAECSQYGRKLQVQCIGNDSANPFEMRVNIQGGLRTATLDTGADVNAISPTILNLDDPNLDILKPTEKPYVTDAQRKPMHVIGAVELEVDGSREPFFIIKNLSKEVILGKPFLTKSFDLVNKVQDSQAYSRPSSACKAKSGTVIPPQAAMFVKALTEKPKSTLQLDGTLHCAPGSQFITPYSIVRSNKGGDCEILVVNLENTPIYLKEGTSLGQAHEPMEITKSAEKRVDSSWTKNEVRLGKDLTRSQEDRLIRMFNEEFANLFGQPDNLSCTGLVQHTIPTGDTPPIAFPARRVAPVQRQTITKEVDGMLSSGIIEPSSSPWAAPVVLVKKKDGSIRFCVDYRKLNTVTKRDVYPLPRIEDALDALSGNSYFSTLDLISGYWQVEMAPDHKAKTAFCTPDGLFQFKRMPFGLANAPATSQRLMDRVIGPLKYRMALVYLDDIIIYSKDFGTHLTDLREVLKRIQTAGLKLKAKKCLFATKEVTYLGHKVTPHGIAPDPEKVAAVKGILPPTNLKELRSFLGLASYYRRFIKNFAAMAAPLYELLTDTTFDWSKKHQQVFENIKEVITKEPVLCHYQDGLETRLQTDASGTGLGAVLVQVLEGKERVVAYASRRLTKAEMKCHSSETECLAVVWAIQKIHSYLYGRHFKVVADSISLKYLKSKANLCPKLVRWAMAIQDYDFEVVHRRGVDNGNADALSRLSVATLCVERVRREQGRDPALRDLLRRPSEGYTVQDQLLHRKGRLCIPNVLMTDAIKLCHEDDMAGHPGIWKTQRRVNERFDIGKGFLAKVRRFVKECGVCQRQNRGR
ncbi:uncharacterized protein LOC108864704 [Galendromus occidentalis]|uniref:RNA-directed DNA polymerase n=1 Tax=Galendromus occidentalis TaxID=34638 RepID=A0AAJ7L6Z3_9ACAR|nr:uncharacterized protein LOC108864704 [Galendromus occidentalis]